MNTDVDCIYISLTIKFLKRWYTESRSVHFLQNYNQNINVFLKDPALSMED